MGDDEIAKALYKVLTEKRCLVILDDIWNSATWDCLKPAFPNVRSESKILLTTRNRDVAFHADRNSILHEPRCFNENESWELFRMKTHFGRDVRDSEDNEKKKYLAREMVDCCGGLPLAITVLVGLLSSKQTVDEWEMLHKNIKTYMRKGKINEQEDSKNLGLSWVLGLSYDELPYHLKPCFLHLAYFPEDFEIRANELCLIWMAEGFVSKEDTAYECLSELVERCIVQVAEWGSTGKIKTCRLHDLMRDLCVSKAEAENFLQPVDLRNQHEGVNSSSLGMATNLLPKSKVRRLAIYLNNAGTDELLSLIRNKDNCLRSFICFNPEPDTSYEKVMKPLLDRFHLLRVLKFENLTRGHVGKLPKEIGNLIHLRLFSLKDSCVEKFPSSIGNLRCLQTLDLRIETSYYEEERPGVEISYSRKKLQCFEIPSVIWKLEQLRHLYLPQNYSIKDYQLERRIANLLRLDNLTNLQTIVNVSINYFYLDELVKLTNLTKLKVNLGFYFGETTVRFNKLRSLAIYRVDCEDICGEDYGKKVESLLLTGPQIYKLRLHLYMEKLPEESKFSPNLVKLTLVRTRLRFDPMATLEKIPSLKILRLDHNAFRGDEMICSRGGFLRLESLSICSLYQFRDWKVEEGALPSLRRLHIEDCLRLRTIPDGLRYVITLKEIVIKLMLRQFKEKVKLDFYTFQHVPSLVFMNTLDF